MASYYREKSPACVDVVLAQLRQMAGNTRTQPDGAVGFLAELFRASPAERERVLKAEPSDDVKFVELVSLCHADLLDEAQKFADAHDLAALFDKLRASRLGTLDAVRPSSLPGDNDLLIGAYMASGNTVYVQRILDNYSSADDGMAGDAFRIGSMMSKFGKGLVPKGRDMVTMQAACAKYQCKTDQTKVLRLMTLATAFWSLQSLATHDDGIKKTLSDFFAHDTRLKNLLTVEQNAFANYLTALVVVTALKPDQATADSGEGYAAMSKSVSIYETLGPANEAFAPMKTPKK